ncbi:MAG TPA: acyl-CoA thioester hydrolase/BAAT C-terminal domain-containing protein [Anaerolineales bacterium]|nr:acyl-CoA thioester hydrolase/BAAT C-terminal domain-containing protein [Anaerolineales bacterium]
MLTFDSEATYAILNDRIQAFSATITTSTGKLDVVCGLAATARQCWAAVPGFPWSRDNTYDSNRWFDDLGPTFNQATVSVARLTSAGDPYAVAVTQQGGGFMNTGTIVIDFQTLLPLSQHGEVRTMDGDRVSEFDVVFSKFNDPVEISLPTPVTPTAIPALSPIPDQYETTQEAAPTPGLLYVPVGTGPFPGVIVLHGSDGGIEGSGPIGARLARAGYVAYVLCYFKCEGTPSSLTGIEIERVSDAVDYLQQRADVRPNEVAAIGISRGAEYALVAGALDPDIHAVVSIMGSSVVVGSVAVNEADYRKPAWVIGGKRVPFVVIPVENINGPVLLLHAENDETWPVTRSYELAARLESFQHPYALTVFPSRGHSLSEAVPGVMNAIVTFLEEAFR